MLAQEEREGQNGVDCELEIGQTKLRDYMKKLTDNNAKMRQAREDIINMLSQSQAPAFLQVTWSLSQKEEVGAWEREENGFLAKRQMRQSRHESERAQLMLSYCCIHLEYSYFF